MKKEYIFFLTGILLGLAYGTYRKKRGRVIVDRIDKISEKEFKRSVGFEKVLI
jgi:uncharacterized membrane protein